MKKNTLEEIKVEIKRSEEEDIIFELSKDIKIDDWVQAEKIKIRTKTWYKEEIIFIGINQFGVEILEKIIQNNKSNYKLVLKEISFKSSYDNIKYDIIIKGYGNYLYPLKLLAKGYFIEEYIAFKHNENDPDLDYKIIKKYSNSWCQDSVISKLFKTKIREYIESFGNNPIQFPISPKQTLYISNFTNYNSKIISLLRIEFHKIVHYSDFKETLHELIKTKNFYGINIFIKFIIEISENLLRQTNYYEVKQLHIYNPDTDTIKFKSNPDLGKIIIDMDNQIAKYISEGLLDEKFREAIIQLIKKLFILKENNE